MRCEPRISGLQIHVCDGTTVHVLWERLHFNGTVLVLPDDVLFLQPQLPRVIDPGPWRRKLVGRHMRRSVLNRFRQGRLLLDLPITSKWWRVPLAAGLWVLIVGSAFMLDGVFRLVAREDCLFAGAVEPELRFSLYWVRVLLPVAFMLGPALLIVVLAWRGIAWRFRNRSVTRLRAEAEGVRLMRGEECVDAYTWRQFRERTGFGMIFEREDGTRPWLPIPVVNRVTHVLQLVLHSLEHGRHSCADPPRRRPSVRLYLGVLAGIVAAILLRFQLFRETPAMDDEFASLNLRVSCGCAIVLAGGWTAFFAMGRTRLTRMLRTRGLRGRWLLP